MFCLRKEDFEKMKHIQYPIEYINIKIYVTVRKIIHTVLHIEYEHIYTSTTAYLRIRVTRIRVTLGLTVSPIIRIVLSYILRKHTLACKLSVMNYLFCFVYFK
jgi:hypothetical protein